MNTVPNPNYGGASGYSSSQYSLSTGQQYQSSPASPSHGQRLSPGIVGVPFASGSPLQSFHLASVATSPMHGTPSPIATDAAAVAAAAAAAGLGSGGNLAFSQSVVSPGALSSSSTFNDYPNYSYNYQQQQPMPKPANVPVTHSYSYQPSTHSTQQQFPSVLVNGETIGALPTDKRQSQPDRPQDAGIQKSKPRAPRNKSKFKRFRNAFIYFVNDQRNKVDDETKKLKNREFLQVMSARWKVMPEDERKPFIQLAEEDKKRFDEDVKKYGKYESRQRRYNKSQPPNTNSKYVYPQGIYDTAVVGQSSGGGAAEAAAAAAAAANFAYAVGGYGNVMPAPPPPMSNAAPQTNISSQFYVGPPAQGGNAASANAPRLGDITPNPGAAMFPTRIQQQMHQSSALLTPPAMVGAGGVQRRSLSSNNSSVANDTSDANAASSLSPGYQWAAAAAAAAAATGENAQAGMIPHRRNHAAYYPNQQHQQPPPVSYLQTPTGAPITHSLTEPMFQLTSQQNPLLSQNQQQSHHQMLQQQQY